MQTYVLLTKMSPEALKSPASMEEIEKRAVKHIEKECPEVKWLHSYALLGPNDYLEIFSAPDMEAALKVSAMIFSYGRAHSEVWGATDLISFNAKNHTQPTKKSLAR